MFLSSSFLPKATKAYNPNHNIASSVLLKPYIKGDIENAGYYFNLNNKNRLVDLDLLLLTQGWSRFNWNEIFNNPPSEKHIFETGIDIILKINNKVLTHQNVQMEYIDPDTNEYFTIKVPFDENNIFKWNNSFIAKNTILKFGIKSNDNVFKIAPSISYKNNFIYDNINTNQVKELLKTPDVFSNFSFLSDDYILLNDVIIRSKLRENKKEDKDGIRMSVISKSYNYIEAFYFGSNQYGFLDINNGNAWDTTSGINGRFSSFSYLFGSTKFRDYNNFSEPVFVNKALNDPFVFKLPVGFAKEKEYYAPKYPSFNEESYLNYGAIFWKPNIEIDANSFVEFHIPNNNQKNIVLQIEGIDNQGNFLTEKITFEN